MAIWDSISVSVDLIVLSWAKIKAVADAVVVRVGNRAHTYGINECNAVAA